MKALRFYGTRDLRYEDVPEPSPGPGEIKTKINVAGICGSDLGVYVSGPPSGMPINIPITLGHEFSGTVTAVGEGVTGFRVGDRVTANCYTQCGKCFFCQKGMYNLCLNQGIAGANWDGCMAECMVGPANAFFSLPDSVTEEAGALVEPLAVAIHAVRQGNVRPGDTVTILGDGPIGLNALLAARTAGAAAVYLVSKHKGRGEVARAMGATSVLYLSDGDPVPRILELTGGLGTDVCIECVGHTNTPELAVNLVRKGGTVAIAGLFDKPIPFDFGMLIFGEKTIVGTACYVDEVKTAIALLADGRINPSPMVTSKISLANAVELGFEKLLADKEKSIKILVQIS